LFGIDITYNWKIAKAPQEPAPNYAILYGSAGADLLNRRQVN